jgi:hypothetical protein
MRTTLTIDDKIARELKEAAHRSGKSYKQVVNETLRAGLTATRILDTAKTYHLKPVSMGAVSSGYNLNKALRLSEHLEDEALAMKLGMNK